MKRKGGRMQRPRGTYDSPRTEALFRTFLAAYSAAFATDRTRGILSITEVQPLPLREQALGAALQIAKSLEGEMRAGHAGAPDGERRLLAANHRALELERQLARRVRDA